MINKNRKNIRKAYSSMYTLGYNSLNLVKQFYYNSNENLSTITTGNWQQVYNFDDTTGNLMSRTYKDLTNPASVLMDSTVLSKSVYYGPGYEKIVTPDSTWENHYIASPYGLEATLISFVTK